MGFLDLFRKRAETEKPEKEQTPDIDIYSGMRVEVTDFSGQLLFVAKLRGLRGNTAELYQYSEAALPEDSEPTHVRKIGRAHV